MIPRVPPFKIGTDTDRSPTYEEDFARSIRCVRGSSSPFSPLNRRGLNTIKPVMTRISRMAGSI